MRKIPPRRLLSREFSFEVRKIPLRRLPSQEISFAVQKIPLMRLPSQEISFELLKPKPASPRYACLSLAEAANPFHEATEAI
jgi:hypothetical protein